MSIGKQLRYERSARGQDATGSLLFDQERKHAVQADAPAATREAPAKKGKKARH